MSQGLPGLRPQQRELVTRWLGDVELVRDMSWGLIDTYVLLVRSAGADLVVKGYGPGNGHLGRELRAHRNWLEPLRDHGRAAALLHADDEAGVLVTDYLPGELVQGSSADADPEIYRQAGELLALLHGQPATADETYLLTARDKAVDWLEQTHRIEPKTEQRLRRVLADHPTHAEQVVPTHGDYTTRNWIAHRGRVCIIDFGRAGLRPGYTDFARLTAREFRRDPGFEAAFLAGYGSDPRTGEVWDFLLVTEAIGTAVWAYQVGAQDFEAEGHEMIARALDRLSA